MNHGTYHGARPTYLVVTICNSVPQELILHFQKGTTLSIPSRVGSVDLWWLTKNGWDAVSKAD